MKDNNPLKQETMRQTNILNLELDPGANKAMGGLEQYLEGSSLDPILIEMVRLLVSLNNGCEHSIQLHTDAAERLNINKGKLKTLRFWWDSLHFTDLEKAVFTLTEEITEMAAEDLADQTFQDAKVHLSEKELMQLIMLIGATSTWNRLVTMSHKFHKQQSKNLKLT